MIPFFSIIIPLYNKEKFIQTTLTSVLEQTFQNFEIIIVNDGSTDGSLTILEQFSDDRLKIIHQKNQGVSTARNKGVKQAKATYIALLDADDIWYPNHLEELHKSIVKYPEAALFCNAYQQKLSSNMLQNAIYNLEKKNDIQIVKDYFKASLIHSIAWTSAVAFNKEKFEELGGFQPHIISGQDSDLWIRFALHTTIVFNPAYTCCYDKTVPNSLFKKHLRKVHFDFLNSYKKEEAINKSLKQYLDINRYAIAIQCKYYGDYDLLKLIKKDIKPSSLTKKQRFLLNSPAFLVKLFKKLHVFFIKKNIYFTAFR